jgi:hypothetical protein
MDISQHGSTILFLLLITDSCLNAGLASEVWASSKNPNLDIKQVYDF